MISRVNFVRTVLEAYLLIKLSVGIWIALGLYPVYRANPGVNVGISETANRFPGAY